MDPSPVAQPTNITNPNPVLPNSISWTKLIVIFLVLLVCLSTLLFSLNDLLVSKYTKISCVWSPDTVAENTQKRNFSIPGNTTLPINRSSTIGILIESKYPTIALGKIGLFYSELSSGNKRFWKQLLFAANNNQGASWMVTPLKKDYLYYFNYSDQSNLTKRGYYHFALVYNKKVIASKTCGVAERVLETDKVIPKSDILKYVK